LLLHIFATDDAQHLYGPNTPEALAAIRGADKHVAKILTALEQAGLKDRANVVVLSDHGFLPVRQQLQLNALFKEEKLLDVDERGRIVRWDAAFQASGGSGFVFLKNPNDAALATRVRTIVERAAADPANGVERVILTEELRRIGADPRASFAVDMREGFYTGYGTDRLVAPASSRGGHGFFPTRPALHASLIMAGPNVSKRGDLGIVRMTQIGPTIASWFGVSLSPKADAPLQ
jgi:predicted AlkP superfamily pyrophosphatase or phosphodiesterase